MPVGQLSTALLRIWGFLGDFLHHGGAMMVFCVFLFSYLPLHKLVPWEPSPVMPGVPAQQPWPAVKVGGRGEQL